MTSQISGTQIDKGTLIAYRRHLRGWLNGVSNKNVLDLGCGNGELLASLRAMGFDRCRGVDLNEAKIARAKQYSIDVSSDDMFKALLASKENYDLITAMDVVEHVPKLRTMEFLRLIRTRLKPGGRLILQTPNGSSPFFGGVRYGDVTHETCFTPRLLVEILKGSGFSDIEVREVTPIPWGYSILSTIRFLLWQVIRIAPVLFDLVETGAVEEAYSRVFLVTARVGR